ncbi:MAG: putative transposase y4pF/y4sB [Frankiales bacterium]|nr:putative transposase y4pF/y4sB [Frankiales bacterium]
MPAVMIGVDPHKRSNTVLVLDASERVLATQRFDNDREGYRELKKFAKTWKSRTWAVEGAHGCGLGLAQRLAAEGETVLNVPAKLSARVRALGGGSGRKTDDTDAFAVAVAGLRGRNLEVVQPDDTATVFKLLSDRRQQLVEQRIATVNRLHQLIQELLPGGASKRLTAKKARELLSTIRPRQTVAKTRKSLALEQLTDLEDLDAKLKQIADRIGQVLHEHPSHVQQIHGIGAVTTAVVLGEVGDVRRFPSKHHFASYTGTAPIDASSGDTIRHRLNRGGNRRLNFVLHVAANVQLATHHPDGYAYYQRKRAAGKSHLEAMRCLKRRLCDVVFRALLEDLADRQVADPVGHSGATLQSSASDPTPMVSPSDQSQPGPATPDATPRRRSSKVPA